MSALLWFTAALTLLALSLFLHADMLWLFACMSAVIGLTIIVVHATEPKEH